MKSIAKRFYPIKSQTNANPLASHPLRNSDLRVYKSYLSTRPTPQRKFSTAKIPRNPHHCKFFNLEFCLAPNRGGESTMMYIFFSHVMSFSDALQKAIADEYLRFEPYLRNDCKRFVIEMNPSYIPDATPNKDINNVSLYGMPSTKSHQPTIRLLETRKCDSHNAYKACLETFLFPNQGDPIQSQFHASTPYFHGRTFTVARMNEMAAPPPITEPSVNGAADIEHGATTVDTTGEVGEDIPPAAVDTPSSSSCLGSDSDLEHE